MARATGASVHAAASPSQARNGADDARACVDAPYMAQGEFDTAKVHIAGASAHINTATPHAPLPPHHPGPLTLAPRSHLNGSLDRKRTETDTELLSANIRGSIRIFPNHQPCVPIADTALTQE